MTDLVGEIIDLNLVEVTWTAPSPAPSQGYHITTATSNDTSLETSLVMMISQLGHHIIQVVPLSQHQPQSTQVTVRGEGVEN